MARQSNNTRGYLIVAGSIALLILAGSLGLFFLKSQPYKELPAFPVESYMEGKNLWGREEYRMEGKVDNVILGSSGGNTLLVSFRPEGSGLLVPVVLEKSGGKTSVQREQKLIMKVTLGKASQIVCSEFASK
ncbi:MAG: hypothetical protein EOP84_05570 [Verrucomicrobiaceae bacterium]|nr:MAG: hypothetical protein EOP84_05570 [Verrucomicrobiaceae bacterium]